MATKPKLIQRGFGKTLITCGRQKKYSPKDVHVLILRTCENITFYRKGNFAEVILNV
jgi:hypothetical protein